MFTTQKLYSDTHNTYRENGWVVEVYSLLLIASSECPILVHFHLKSVHAGGIEIDSAPRTEYLGTHAPIHLC